ncbi:MAG TPA: HAMP domain-containing sensor histidine kinase [Caulobacteraceae bacterium]|nr:HAMP domain-containing sensor histidine kinase [Caulobacteraceae bacterium]
MSSAYPRRPIAGAGARLALVQAVLVIAAFVLAGYLTQVSAKLIIDHDVRERVLGEVSTLDDEVAQKGAPRLPHTIIKRSKQARGFDYRLSGEAGQPPAGELMADGLKPGWTYLGGDKSGQTVRPPSGYLVYTKRLADGAMLSVGEDLSGEATLSGAMAWTLFWCGALGAAFCLSASYLFTRGAWRRISAVTAAAREVTAGRLDVRVKTRAGFPGDDIDGLGHTFNAMLGEIAALMSQVRQVSTDIAHDLRTPLARVRQRLELLKRSADGQPALVSAVERIDAEIEEILRTFDAMLKLAELENDGQGLRLQRVDLAEVAARVADAFRPDIEHSGRSLQTDLEPADIDGDGALIAQAMANLLDNALRHTPEGTAIGLCVRRRPGGADLTVVDRGPGVAPEHRAAVLQRFRRLDSSRSTRGSGLGLAIVAAIAKRHRAELTLADAGPGLKVELRFVG